jgi:hypothetical protein
MSGSHVGSAGGPGPGAWHLDAVVILKGEIAAETTQDEVRLLLASWLVLTGNWCFYNDVPFSLRDVGPVRRS